jgi:hypothetical protein
MSHCDSSPRNMCQNVTKMSIFQVDIESVHLEIQCLQVKLSRGKMSPWTFQVGLNVTVEKTCMDVMSRHPEPLPVLSPDSCLFTVKVASEVFR